MLAEIKRSYTARIEELEQRLLQVERRSAQTATTADDALSSAEEALFSPAAPVAAGPNAFNPAIGVVLSGGYAALDTAAEEYSLPGFILGPETGPGEEGLRLGETEINLQGNVDDKFFANLTLAVAVEDGEAELELEEAYLQTTSLPGFSITAGRFFSAIGYLNSFHSHSDDFADRPLPYQAFLANQYKDDGVQFRWIVPRNTFLEIGTEIMLGDAFPASGAKNSGRGAYTFFAHLGGDLGTSHSWRFGISHLKAKVADRIAADPDEGAAISFMGTSDLTGFDFVWKWAPDGNPTVNNWKLQGEYFWRDESGSLVDDGGQQNYRGDQTGWYLQSVYQFIPRWQLGIRHDELHADNKGVTGSLLDPLGRNPHRDSASLEWKNSEFSRVRVQYTRDRSTLSADDQFLVQYVHSLGSHRAHQF
jgi:hypothetical protein|tara:strand:- start:222 stop:1481 length:1260 start_codon:yes stop_codon:yes gene_type:complete